jgi:hypothetical protein
MGTAGRRGTRGGAPPVTLLETTEFFIACARCYELKNADGSLRRHDGDVVWLGESDGYPACWEDKSSAKQWKTIEEIQKSWLRWDGMPWYNRFKPDSLKIIHVTERRTFSREEREI